MRGVGRRLAAALLFGACAHPTPAAPAPEVRFRVVGEAAPSDAGPASAQVAGDVVTIRGAARRVEGGGVYGDVDLSEAGTIRLTLYDSLPGRAVEASLPSGSRFRRVVYEARIGPLAPGAYQVVVGWFDPRAELIVVWDEPLHVEIRPVIPRRLQTD